MKNITNSRASAANNSAAKVSLIITTDQRQQLYDLGYSNADVNAMPPAKAHDILAEGLNKSQATKPEPTITISLFDSKNDAKPKETQWTLPQLITELSTFRIGAKDGKLFSPAKFKPKRRAKENVIELSLFVGDLDHDITIDWVAEKLHQLDAMSVLHTTFSHQQDAHRCRIAIVPIEPIPEREYESFWQRMNEHFEGKLDPACKDTSRMFYLPAKATETAPSDVRKFGGVLIDWRKIKLDKSPIKTPKAKAKQQTNSDCTPEGQRELDKWISRLLKSSKGNRNTTFNSACYWLGHSVQRKELSESLAIETLRRTASAIGLEEREIEATIKSGLYDGIAHAIAEAQATSDDGNTATLGNAAANGANAQKKNRQFFSGRFLFTTDKKGVWAANAETQTKMKVCSPLTIEADTRNARGEGWGRLLIFQDREGREKSWVMPHAWLAGDRSRYREKLLDMGLSISPEPEAPALLHAYLHKQPEQIALSVDHVGWAEDGFVFPDVTIGGKDGQRIYLQASSGVNNLLETSSALNEWQESIGHYCIGNSRLVFVVSAAFAAPLLTPYGIAGGGFHFMGKSSVGKSTSQYVAGSVWGGGGKDGYVQTWKATATGLEYLSEYHNDNLLCLDEIGEANPKDIGQSVYMIANGRGKHRGQAGGGLRKQSTWNVLALSSGEKTLSEYMAEDGQKIKEGQEVRLIHLPADAGAGFGLFEDLHGFSKGKDFSDHLKSASLSHYGTPIRAFLERLINQRLVTATRQKFEEFKKKFIADNVKNDADELAGRAADRFAVIGFAGELATEWDITGWPVGEATKAALRLFRDWMIFRGQRDGGEDAGVRRVVEFTQRHGSSRFQAVDKDGKAVSGEKVINRAGFKKYDEDGNLIEYAIFPEVFRAEICAGFDPQKVAGRLKAIGLLAEADGNNLPAKRTFGELGRRRYFVIKNLPDDENEVGQVGQSDATG